VKPHFLAGIVDLPPLGVWFTLRPPIIRTFYFTFPEDANIEIIVALIRSSTLIPIF